MPDRRPDADFAQRYNPPLVAVPAALPGKKFAPAPLVKINELALTVYLVPVAEPENDGAPWTCHDASRSATANADVKAGVPVNVQTTFAPPMTPIPKYAVAET
jgi:hypothetical protein